MRFLTARFLTMMQAVLQSSRLPWSGGSEVRSPGEHGYLPAALVWGCTALLIFRFFWATYRHAVNLFFSDDWVYFDVLSSRMSYWQMFALRHGPHREGIGMVATSICLKLTNWNSRSEAFLIATVIVLASLLAMRLKIRVFGPLKLWDVTIPLMFLTLAQWELLVGGPGASPQAFPLMLIMAYCLAWMQRNELWGMVSVLFINVLLLYTGYGLFMAGITLVLLAVDLYQSWKLKEKARTWLLSVSMTLAAGSVAFFFRGYVFSPAAQCYRFPYDNPARYPLFIALMFARFAGIKHHPVLAGAAGFIILAAVSACLLWYFVGLARRGSKDEPSRVITILAGYSLIQAGAVAIGRICFGMETSQSSRYMTLLIPAFLSLYFGLLAAPVPRSWRNGLLAILFIAVFSGSVQKNHKEMEGVAASRRAWKQCFVRTENVDFCTASTGLEIYLPTQHRQLMENLQYLKRNHLNLYAAAD